MPLETGSFINDLTPTNPPGSDPAGQGDDHIRLIKATVQGTFPNMGAILGQVRRQDTALSISSTWNTNHFIASASATATVVLTLPPAASITAGFYVDITTIGTGTVSLLPSGAASINGGVSLSIPQLNTARAYFLGGAAWLADVVPHGQGGIYNIGALNVSGAMSVSGAASLGGAVSISGAATLMSTLSVSGATSLAALTVNGVCTLSSAVHMKSTLSVSGASVLAALTVNGICTMSSAVHMKSTCSISGGLSVAGAATISATLVMIIGQLSFPATQVASSDVNILDDYEEGTFTPVLTFQVPGNITSTYSIREAIYTKVGRVVAFSLRVLTSAFAHTTATGSLVINGMPFTSHASGGSLLSSFPTSRTSGINGTGYTMLHAELGTSATALSFVLDDVPSGNSVFVDITTATSGVNKELIISGSYLANA